MATNAANDSRARVLASRVHLYVAPVDRASGAPAALNLARDGMFPLEQPPAPWVATGWIDNFARSAETAIEAVRCGPQGAAQAQFRRKLEARVSFTFGTWGKIQMAIAGGGEHFNILAAGSDGTAVPKVALLEGSTATELKIGAAAVELFRAGDRLAVDADYGGETGYVGAGIAGAFVRDTEAAPSDSDYLRRITCNVGEVAAAGADSLTLAAALAAGVPAAGMGVQKIAGFCDREGGAFFQDWSLLFVVAEEGGGRLCLHYPRMQAAVPAGEHVVELAGPLRAMMLRASLRALPVPDPIDGQPALCYRAYFPAAQ